MGVRERERESAGTMPNSGHEIIHDKAIGAPARKNELINEAWNAIEKHTHTHKKEQCPFFREGLVVFHERARQPRFNVIRMCVYEHMNIHY